MQPTAQAVGGEAKTGKPRMSEEKGRANNQLPMTSPTPTERDPVCGMSVNPATAKHVHAHAGKNYYFCCANCLEKFKTNPQGYLNKPAGPGYARHAFGCTCSESRCSKGGHRTPASSRLRLPHVPRSPRAKAWSLSLLWHGS